MIGLHSRRALLAGAGAVIASAATAFPAVDAAAHSDACALSLDNPAADPAVRYERALAEFKAAAEALYPDIYEWASNHGETGVLAFGRRPPQPVKFTGYGVYEVQIGKASPIVALAASENGKGYFWQHYWLAKDRLEDQPQYIAARRISIVRKLRALEVNGGSK